MENPIDDTVRQWNEAGISTVSVIALDSRGHVSENLSGGYDFPDLSGAQIPHALHRRIIQPTR
jgi:hypothetical protein